MSLFDEVAKITEAYCIEHNLPCTRRYSHEELAPYIAWVRAIYSQLYAASVPVAEDDHADDDTDPRYDEDAYLDDPRRGQAAGINRDNRGRG